MVARIDKRVARQEERTKTWARNDRAVDLARLAERLRRAILTLAVQPEREMVWLAGGGSTWPEIVREWRNGDVPNSPRARRFRPTPADIDDMLPMLGLLAWLKHQPGSGARDYRIIVARAFGVTWWKIAQKYGRSERQVNRWYDGAIARIHENMKKT